MVQTEVNSNDSRVATLRFPEAAILLLPLGRFSQHRREIIGERLAAELAGLDVIVQEVA